MVRIRGLEPPRLSAQAPQACVTTNSTISALGSLAYCRLTKDPWLLLSLWHICKITSFSTFRGTASMLASFSGCEPLELNQVSLAYETSGLPSSSAASVNGVGCRNKINSESCIKIAGLRSTRRTHYRMVATI